MRQNTEVAIEMIRKEVDNPILANALLSGKFDATTMVAGQITKLTKAMNDLEAKDMEYIDLFTYNPDVLGNTKADPDQT